jgi:hypothetical protein
MTIKYSCLYNNNDIISESPVLEQVKIANTVSLIFKTITPQSNGRHCVEDIQNQVKYHYHTESNYVIFCVITYDTPSRIADNFINATYDKIKNLSDLKFSKKILDANMKIFNDPNSDKITALQSSIDNAKDTMTINIDRALARGDRLDTLNQKADDMRTQSEVFNNNATKLKREMWLRNMKFFAMVSAAVIILIIIIVIIVCSSSKC